MSTSPVPGQNLALSGIRIVDFSRLLPGPWATQLLADMGADVIKVEQPDSGDYSRHNPPNFETSGVYFNSVNAGKRSIALDLRQESGRAVAHKLITGADVIVESFRTGVPKNLDVHYERARQLNEKIVYCSITGYGQDGVMATVPGHDLVIQSMTGLMGMTLDRDPHPPVPGFQAADYAAGAVAPTAILAALMRRDKTGEGAYIDLSMFDCLFYMCNIVLTGAMSRLAGKDGLPGMQSWGGNPRYSTYVAGDGKPVAVSLLEAKAWKQFCDFIERPELVDPNESPADRHSTHGDRESIYRDTIAGYISAHTRDSLLAKMEAEQIPICAVYTPDEAARSAPVEDRGLIAYSDHPTEGRIPHLVNPLARSGLANAPYREAPELGADSDDVLSELGYSESEQELLRKSGAVT